MCNEKSEQRDVISLVKEYLNIRLALKFKADAFFMQIRHSKAVGQSVGMNTFGGNCCDVKSINVIVQRRV